MEDNIRSLLASILLSFSIGVPRYWSESGVSLAAILGPIELSRSVDSEIDTQFAADMKRFAADSAIHGAKISPISTAGEFNAAAKQSEDELLGRLDLLARRKRKQNTPIPSACSNLGLDRSCVAYQAAYRERATGLIRSFNTFTEPNNGPVRLIVYSRSDDLATFFLLNADASIRRAQRVSRQSGEPRTVPIPNPKTALIAEFEYWRLQQEELAKEPDANSQQVSYHFHE